MKCDVTVAAEPLDSPLCSYLSPVLGHLNKKNPQHISGSLCDILHVFGPELMGSVQSIIHVYYSTPSSESIKAETL
jgi:hypothetical protein